MNEDRDEEVKPVRFRILIKDFLTPAIYAMKPRGCTQRPRATTNPSRMSLSQRSRILDTTEIIISYVRDGRDPLLRDLDAVRREDISIQIHGEAVTF